MGEEMSIFNIYKTYSDELNLIFKQNPIECELYSIIASLIRGCENSEKISLRDVSTRRLSKYTGSQIFTSKAGFPDFVVLEKDFQLLNTGDDSKHSEDKVLGAVEVKRMSISIGENPAINSTQLQSHIEKFKKVIYTNGIEWCFYDDGDYNTFKWSHSLGKIENGRINWLINDKTWRKLLDDLNKIEWKV